jgi:pentatricopeptide repeat protein
MEANGPEPNIYTYNTVTRAFAENGRLNEAIKILTSIQSRGLSPDRFTFTTLLIACGRTNSSEEVGLLLEIIRNFWIIVWKSLFFIAEFDLFLIQSPVILKNW